MTGRFSSVWPDDEQSRRFEHGTHPPVESAKAPAAQRDTVTGSMPTTAVSMSVTVSVKVPVMRSGNTQRPR